MVRKFKLIIKRQKAKEPKIKAEDVRPVEIIIDKRLKINWLGGGKKKKEEEKGIEAMEIPEVRTRFKAPLPAAEDYELIRTDMKYSLIPRDADWREAKAYAWIHWDREGNELIYEVVEPRIEEAEKPVLEKVRRMLEEMLEIEPLAKGKDVEKVLDSKLSSIFSTLGISSPSLMEKISYHIKNDILGYGKIEAIYRDPNIEDISCDGVGIPIYVYHRNPKFGSLRTNIVFNDRRELDEFVIRLAEKAGKSINIARPLLDEALPDGSRIQLTLGTDIAHKGSNFTIRKFTEKPLTPVDLIRNGTVDIPTMALLWMAVEFGASILISGGTGTGKTSMLNALSLFIKPQMKIVSIEDTPELRLPHPHWVPEVARNVMEGEKGSVDMFDLLKESLRQRPDYIIVGEVRGKEASVLFQQIATGHPGMATMHADSFEKLVDRLITPPINLSPSLIENLDAVLFLKRLKYRNIYVRRLASMHEIAWFDRKAGMPKTNLAVEWESRTDTFAKRKSIILKKILDTYGFSERQVIEEFRDRAAVLESMVERGIADYVEFADAVNKYYAEKDVLMAELGL